MHVSLRTLVVTLGISLVAACGGDSPTAAAPKCTTPGLMSTPGMASDPCKQDSAPCLAIHGTGVAMCLPDGSWAQCACMQPPGTGTMAGAMTAQSACGNNAVEPNLGEQCEQGMVTATCASLLGAGSQGLVMCVNCRYDMSNCMAAALAPMTTGGTGPLPQGGAGH
jgi:hypothetical protein